MPPRSVNSLRAETLLPPETTLGHHPVAPSQSPEPVATSNLTSGDHHPAAKPSILSSGLRLTPRAANTVAAPKAVTPQVKPVASSAWRIGERCMRKSTIAE